MARAFCLPAIFFLLSATVLLVLTSISLPYLPAFDIVRIHFDGSEQPDAPNFNGTEMDEARLGIWAYCTYHDRVRSCYEQRAYNFGVQSPANSNFEEVRSSWTRGLAVTPVAAGFSFIALLLGLSQHLTVTLLASLTAFFAAVLTLIAFAIQIALFAFTKHKMKNLGIDAGTMPGPGFWLTLASLILLLLGGCTVCFGRRRDRATTRYEADPTVQKAGFFSRFRFRRNTKW